ncbi:hypothetical protein [Catellatospora tritici]|uniref:hypothetical protein n=1 Tax=Catellatospora tritici TaxID=2851566 RepID=UPI001C2D74FA|nr:hypothetical protein [Catellatospora tritici]MBV1855521.1 hypothetical protein [Catellatospora tritici]
MSEKPLRQQVKVDLVGLKEVATAVRDQTAKELSPGLERCNKLMQHGVRFGLRSPSGPGYAARHAFAATLTTHFHNGEAHLQTAAALSLAIDNILTHYADADHVAAAKLETVDALLAQAAALVRPSSQPSQNPYGRGDQE